MNPTLTASTRLSPGPAFDMHPGEAYTIRRQVFRLLGAAFHIYNPAGAVIGYCKQKAFKLREDIRIYTDETCSTEMMVIKARSIIDFGATYDVALSDGTVVGSLRRKGLASTFLRDEWLVFDHSGREIARLREDGSVVAFARRYLEFISLLSPQKFTLAKSDGTEIARYRQHFNLFVYRLSVAALKDDPEIDDFVILAAGCLIAAIEGRQSSN